MDPSGFTLLSGDSSENMSHDFNYLDFFSDWGENPPQNQLYVNEQLDREQRGLAQPTRPPQPLKPLPTSLGLSMEVDQLNSGCLGQDLEENPPQNQLYENEQLELEQPENEQCEPEMGLQLTDLNQTPPSVQLEPLLLSLLSTTSDDSGVGGLEQSQMDRVEQGAKDLALELNLTQPRQQLERDTNGDEAEDVGVVGTGEGETELDQLNSACLGHEKSKENTPGGESTGKNKTIDVGIASPLGDVLQTEGMDLNVVDEEGVPLLFDGASAVAVDANSVVAKDIPPLQFSATAHQDELCGEFCHERTESGGIAEPQFEYRCSVKRKRTENTPREERRNKKTGVRIGTPSETKGMSLKDDAKHLKGRTSRNTSGGGHGGSNVDVNTARGQASSENRLTSFTGKRGLKITKPCSTELTNDRVFRSSLRGIMTLIKELNLRTCHKEVLKRTPFWGMFEAIIENKLSPPQCRYRGEMIIKIINMYDPDTRKFRLGRQFVELTRADMVSIFGISSGKEFVSLKYHRKEGIKLVERLGIPESRLTSTSLKQYLKKCVGSDKKDDVEDVARLLCVYLCHTFFFPTGTTVKWVYLERFEDLDRLRDYDWNKAIINELMSSISMHHHEPRKVTGCVMALMYWLCEHTNLSKADDLEHPLGIVKWNIPVVVSKLKKIRLKDLKPRQVVSRQANVARIADDEVRVVQDSVSSGDVSVSNRGNDACSGNGKRDEKTQGRERGPAPITRRLKTRADSERARQLYQCFGRSSPELLNYLPTYRCWLKKKPARARKLRKSADTTETLLSHPVGDPPESSLPEEETMPPKIDLVAKLAEMMAKNKKAPTKRKEKVTAGRVQISIPEDERPAKRPREDAHPPMETERPPTGTMQPEVEVLTRAWSPTLVNSEGRSIMNTNSVHADPRLGLGLLPALGLKNDLEMVPDRLEDNFYHCSSLLVQAGQSMLKLHGQVLELDSTAKKYKGRADAALAKVEAAEGRAEELRTENESLERELAEWRLTADRRLEQQKAEHEKALEEAKQEAHNAGFAEAGEAYAEDILRLVKEGEKKGFGKGYLHCCRTFGVATEDPKCDVPAMPDSPIAEDSAEDEEAERLADDSHAKKTTDEGTSSGQMPSEDTTGKTIT